MVYQEQKTPFLLPLAPPGCLVHHSPSHSHPADTVARSGPRWPTLRHKVSHSQLSQRGSGVKTRDGGLVVRILGFPIAIAQVQSLVGEVR